MKTHLNLRTRDLEASVAFYRTLLDAAPAKEYGDYALFLTDDPGLELALDLDADVAVGESAHYGITVPTPAGVEAAIERLRGAGQPVDVEVEETCCYAKQTKVWASDPDGRRWEVYTVLEETAERDDESTPCCVS
ncbi:MAG TPA: ArsI/CadI family heavy metal resistance metalloenzyme [Candidatus Dormibacteraeota bacterium]|nr:ArsI/CadI family heavy metal resistance metalloenzyme [Candidatus Dormibacteraeota bacterium]